MTEVPLPDPPPRPSRASRPGFAEFYREHFRAEHQHPGNIALHVLGVIASAAWLVWTINSETPWLALAYPAVHAAPGLLGHRMFEPNASVGDVRVFRKDFPGYWFILANHLMVLDLVVRGLRFIQRTL